MRYMRTPVRSETRTRGTEICRAKAQREREREREKDKQTAVLLTSKDEADEAGVEKRRNNGKRQRRRGDA